MIAVYKKEMRAYFTNMMGYIFLAFMLLLMGIWFVLISVFGMTGNFQNVLSNTTIFFFVLIPILTMRLFSEEARQKTDQLLFTSPLSVVKIVMGKFFAATTLFIIGVVITLIFVLMINNYGDLPWSRIWGAYIGFVLLGVSMIAVGVFISVLTDNQIVAAIATVGAIFLMFIIDSVALSMPITTSASFIFVGLVIAVVAIIWYNSIKNVLAAIIVAVLGLAVAGGLYLYNNLIYDAIIVRVMLWFSVYARFNSFAMGLLTVQDIVYYVSFAILFVYLTINVLEKRRWR